MRLWRRRVRSAVVATAAAVLFLAAATSQGHTALKTALFLPQVISAVPVKPQTWVTRDPARREVQFPIATGLGTADLYTPAGDEIHSAVLLFLGVNPAGRNDPRVVGPRRRTGPRRSNRDDTVVGPDDQEAGERG